MSHTGARVLALALLAVLPGCNHTLNLEVPTGTPVHLVTDQPIRSDDVMPDKEVLLQPDTAEYRHLQQWLAHNQTGWSQSLATNPSGGIVVHAGKLSLQFVGTAVFTWTDKGQFQKNIRKEDYAFLKKPAGI